MLVFSRFSNSIIFSSAVQTLMRLLHSPPIILLDGCLKKCIGTCVVSLSGLDVNVWSPEFILTHQSLLLLQFSFILVLTSRVGEKTQARVGTRVNCGSLITILCKY